MVPVARDALVGEADQPEQGTRGCALHIFNWAPRTTRQAELCRVPGLLMGLAYKSKGTQVNFDGTNDAEIFG